MPHVVRDDNPVRHRAGGFAPRVGETLRVVVVEGEVFGLVGARLRLDGAGPTIGGVNHLRNLNQ